MPLPRGVTVPLRVVDECGSRVLVARLAVTLGVAFAAALAGLTPAMRDNAMASAATMRNGMRTAER